jgi:hypothetical protein
MKRQTTVVAAFIAGLLLPAAEDAYDSGKLALWIDHALG